MDRERIAIVAPGESWETERIARLFDVRLKVLRTITLAAQVVVSLGDLVPRDARRSLIKDLVFRMLNGIVEAYEGSDQFAVIQISQCLSKWLCVRRDASDRSDASMRTKLSFCRWALTDLSGFKLLFSILDRSSKIDEDSIPIADLTLSPLRRGYADSPRIREAPSSVGLSPRPLNWLLRKLFFIRGKVLRRLAYLRRITSAPHRSSNEDLVQLKTPEKRTSKSFDAIEWNTANEYGSKLLRNQSPPSSSGHTFHKKEAKL